MGLSDGTVSLPASHAPRNPLTRQRDIDALSTFETAGSLLTTKAPTRYAVRQVLDQELQRTLIMRDNAARQARLRTGAGGHGVFVFDDKENRTKQPGKDKANATTGSVRRDFFGRVIVESAGALEERDGNVKRKRREGDKDRCKVWVTYNEGLNNAVRKPISLEEFLRGF